MIRERHNQRSARRWNQLGVGQLHAALSPRRGKGLGSVWQRNRTQSNGDSPHMAAQMMLIYCCPRQVDGEQPTGYKRWSNTAPQARLFRRIIRVWHARTCVNIHCHTWTCIYTHAGLMVFFISCWGIKCPKVFVFVFAGMAKHCVLCHTWEWMKSWENHR